MAKKIDSIKHSEDKRAHIPSKEEAGYEDASESVQKGAKSLDLPKNPVVTRGQDPELFWLNKYGNDDRDDLLRVDIRSLYRHEHIAPENLIRNLYRIAEDDAPQGDLFAVNDIFGNALDREELEKISDYYVHQDGWTNRLIQGDSHLVMASLLEREGMAGQVQMIYIDPPYGIKYGSNWQIKLDNRNVKDGSDEALTGEPEVIKAFRDTWELGVHSYLSYVRDRLVIAKELLAESGSCFVQISDENAHLIRNLMDEVFGSENFISTLSFKRSSGFDTKFVANLYDHIIWFGKNLERTKYRQLYELKHFGGDSYYDKAKLADGTIVNVADLEDDVPPDAKYLLYQPLVSSGESKNLSYDFEFNNKKYSCGKNRHWKTTKDGLQRLAQLNRIYSSENTIKFIRYHEDYPASQISNVWDDTVNLISKDYVVQTNLKVIQRCVLMTTDPGDLVLDPTCGSGTTAFVAEQFGRRWITTDTSRIALNISKTRLMTATYPYYKLYDDERGDIRQGFIYKTVPHITLKSLANDEPPATETLYDKPEIDAKKLRVSGPFTVETLQNFEPVSSEDLTEEKMTTGDSFEQVIKDHLLATGVKNGRSNEHALFTRIELLSHGHLHAEGFYQNGTGEKKAYFHFGPKFGTVSKKAVTEAIVECRARGDAKWLIILGFSFESDIQGGAQTTSQGSFEVTRARIHDDLLQEGLKKKPARSAASFVTIGEPDISLEPDHAAIGGSVIVEIKGLDIYDPIKDEVKARDLHDVAYWMVDDNYDGSNFVVRQVFFCGGDKDEFKKWKDGINKLSQDKTRKRAEKTLGIEIDEEAFERVYGYRSHPITIKDAGQKIAVRVISQFGEESMKVLQV